jgi:phosphoglycolate phosphatase-like HAD superfamily hydrolase
MADYDGVLLDHDGVLVGLTDHSALREAAHSALAAVGVTDPSRADVEAITIGVSADELGAVADRHGVAPDRLWQAREDRIDRLMRDRARSGGKAPYEDVEALTAVDRPLGVVSNNQTRIVEFLLAYHGLAEHFGTVRAREPTVESLSVKKPAPTFLERATADLGCSTPLYVGDSESDVVAAHRAGFDSVFLRRDHNADQCLDADPTYDLSNLSAVVDLLR